MVGIQALLLNILFIILSILIYQIFYFEKAMRLTGKGRNPLVIATLGSITATLCMLFPFQMMPGHIFDMRTIPLLIAMLYGGRTAGVIVYVATLTVCYFLGADGFYAAFFMHSVITVALYLLERRFARVAVRERIYLMIASAAISSVFIIVYSGWRISQFVELPEQFPVFIVEYCFIQIIGVCICVYLIESTIKTIELKMGKSRSDMMYAMGELAASVAHEIRNPLTAVRGFAQLLHEGEGNVQSYRSYTQIMVDELDRAEAIISDYLTFANPSIRHKESVDIAQYVKHIGDLMSSYALIHRVQIEVDVHLNTMIMIDRSKLTQCLVNVIKNGIEAMPDGGQLRLSAVREGSWIVFQIADEGKGMEVQELKRLGQPFYSTKEKGTGLGLMVSYRIVEALQGKITVESIPGRGTCFSVWLPSL